MERMFRPLRADEIECRIATINANGLSLLLYKDARVDQNILDETVGPARWQRRHELINGNLFCSVGILFGAEWIWKQDVGTESYTEKEKGQASDAFKRACFNWGIGRELYTAPFIWIPKGMFTAKEKDGKTTTYDKFDVTKIDITDGAITGMVITNTKMNKVVFTYGRQAEKAERPQEAPQQSAPRQAAQPPQVGPVTNETVQKAYQERQEQDLNKLCSDIELAQLESIIHKLWPKRAIESIFQAWPNVTKRQFGEFNQTVRNMQNRRAANA